MSIHSENEQVILEFGLKKPAFRIVVNSPTTHGSIGLTTGLDPAMTLGCGGYGGNITSDNISPRHLLNIKRLAYGIRPAVSRFDRAPADAAVLKARPARQAEPAAGGISQADLAERIDRFLGSRGFRTPEPPAARKIDTARPAPAAPPRVERSQESPTPAPQPSAGSAAVAADRTIPGPAAQPAPAAPPLTFVCEDDVRRAIASGRTLVVSERAIVTPSARELAEAHRVLTFV
jgi:hypothetical protein